MSQQSINICSVCSQPMESLVNFTPFRIEDAQSNCSNPFISARETGILNEKWCNIYICYTCAANSKKEMTDEEFFDKYPQPKQIYRSTFSGNICDFNPPPLIRCTAIDNCRDDYIVLKKDDDLYVYKNLDSYEIRSSITFDMVPNYRYNEITRFIEKIDPTIEEEDRRLIALQKNPNAILFEEYEKTRDKILQKSSRK